MCENVLELVRGCFQSDTHICRASYVLTDSMQSNTILVTGGGQGTQAQGPSRDLQELKLTGSQAHRPGLQWTLGNLLQAGRHSGLCLCPSPQDCQGQRGVLLTQAPPARPPRHRSSQKRARDSGSKFRAAKAAVGRVTCSRVYFKLDTWALNYFCSISDAVLLEGEGVNT